MLLFYCFIVVFAVTRAYLCRKSSSTNGLNPIRMSSRAANTCVSCCWTRHVSRMTRCHRHNLSMAPHWPKTVVQSSRWSPYRTSDRTIVHWVAAIIFTIQLFSLLLNELHAIFRKHSWDLARTRSRTGRPCWERRNVSKVSEDRTLDAAR